MDEEKKAESKPDADFSSIQVIEVTQSNFNAVWPYLLVSMKAADYAAIDLELSGLGSREGSRAKNLDDRYAAIRESAQSRSVISLGLAFYKLMKKSESKRKMFYKCQVFNILTLCSQPFTIEPESLIFLSKHSFDFNRLINHGVRYEISTVHKSCPIRSLFAELFASAIPVFLHNGLIDIAFIYHHFYSPLPESLGEFCNAVCDLLPPESPLVDSKYLAEYQARFGASFLEYVFRRCQGDNVREAIAGRYCICIEFESTTDMMASIKDNTEEIACPLPSGFPDHPVPHDLHGKLCTFYVNHGYCFQHSKGKCSRLHDVDFAIDLEYQRREKERSKRKRKFDHLKPANVLEEERAAEEEKHSKRMENSLSVDDLDGKCKIAVSGCHRAGIDAFMTGFAVLYMSRTSLFRDGCIPAEQSNRLPLSGKDQPLHIQRSQFAKECPLHMERFAHLDSARRRKIL